MVGSGVCVLVDLLGFSPPCCWCLVSGLLADKGSPMKVVTPLDRDTPGLGYPITHPHLWRLGSEAHFLVPGSHFVFVPAFGFSTVPANTHIHFHSHCWNCSTRNLGLSISLLVFFFTFCHVLPPLFLSQLVLTKG